MWSQVDSGSFFQATDITNAVRSIPGNNKVRLTLKLNFIPSTGLMNNIQNQMTSRGIQGAKVSSGSPILNIDWLKPPTTTSGVGFAGVDDATLIIIGIILVLILAIMIVGWIIFKQVGPVNTTMLIAGGLGIVIFGLALYFRRRPNGQQ